MRYFTLKISEYSSIQEAMNAIPAGETHLDLSDNYLGERSGAELAALLSGIPRSVTSIDLFQNNLGQLLGADLVTLLSCIPVSVTHLNLVVNRLGQRSGAELEAVFSSIRGSVTHLNLLGNDLGQRSGADLGAAFARIPVSVTHFDLGKNDLGERSGAELEAALSGIPVSVTHLNLLGNDLGQRSGAELEAVFASISRSVTHLGLSSNNLGQRSGEELKAGLSGIPVSVTSLDLRFNYLGRLSGAELAVVFASIPISVTHLNLRNNNLGNLSGDDLKTALSGIPAGVTHLNLADIYLNLLSGDDLAVALSGIPGSVRHLDLSGYDLARMAVDDLKTVLSSIPAGVTSLDLSGAYLAWPSIANNVLASIPNTVKEVKLANHALTSTSEAQLKEAFSGLPEGTMISFKGERIFIPGNRVANDALLKKLRSAAAGRSLCLTNTGESDLVRGLSTLVGLSKQVVPSGRDSIDMPSDVIYYIASFLVPQGQVKNLYTLFRSDIVKAVMGRESENSNQKVRIVNTLDLSKEGLRCLLAPQLQAIFEEMPRHIRKVILSDEDIAEMSVDNLSAALRCLHPKMIIKLTTNDQALLAKLLDAAEGLGLKVETGLITPFTMFNTGIVGSNKSLYQDTVCWV